MRMHTDALKTPWIHPYRPPHTHIRRSFEKLFSLLETKESNVVVIITCNLRGKQTVSLRSRKKTFAPAVKLEKAAKTQWEMEDCNTLTVRFARH